MSELNSLQDTWAATFKGEVAAADYRYCFGCGPENPDGLQIKSFWDGKHGICRWKADSYHNGIKGRFNGGILATLIDCHSFWTALAATYHNEDRRFGDGEPLQMVTASLSVSYLHPIPLDAEIELKAYLVKVGNRSKVVACSVNVDDQECARGEVTLVVIPVKTGT